MSTIKFLPFSQIHMVALGFQCVGVLPASTPQAELVDLKHALETEGRCAFTWGEGQQDIFVWSITEQSAKRQIFKYGIPAVTWLAAHLAALALFWCVDWRVAVGASLLFIGDLVADEAFKGKAAK